jgi:hypothetical protein
MTGYQNTSNFKALASGLILAVVMQALPVSAQIPPYRALDDLMGAPSSPKKGFAKRSRKPVHLVTRPNQSFLRDQNYTLDKEEAKVRDKIFEPKMFKQLGQEYQDMNRTYEMRENHHLNTQQDQRDYLKRASNFARYVMRKVFTFQFNEGMKKAEKNSDDVKTFNQVKSTVEKVARGDTTAVDSGPEFKFGTKADIPQQKGGLWMKSTIVDSDAEVAVGKPWGLDPFSFENLDRKQKRELYRVSIGRDIPLIDARTGLAYGGTTNTVTGSVSKQLTQHLSTELSSTRDAGSWSDTSKSDNVVKMLFGTRF